MSKEKAIEYIKEARHDISEELTSRSRAQTIMWLTMALKELED